MSAFSKILIANRGEIACRVIWTARDMGYRTVAVYSDADAAAPHVEQADEAVHIGASPASQSYLVIEKIIEAAQKTGADAIHPGYGFLSENADFARACEAADIIFIGPSAEAIELMGSKRLSKIAMIDAGVSCIPGYQGADQSDETLLAEALKVGFPLMVKASAGGGGRGMRLVHEESELADQIKTARSEAINAFGSGELILERAVINPRHIEIQVFADAHGNVVHLGERDCSIQRRHQKVVEEAPSPFVDDDLRADMGEAAVNVALSCNYRGAGTVEFLVDEHENFYFLEMNTRLQVEHPVTEMVTGTDLVEWQLRVAAGERLPLEQHEIVMQGHAIEVRLYAEDPRQNFMPQTGKILGWDTPKTHGFRLESGVNVGQTVSPFYDPMLAKLVVFGDSREAAARKLGSVIEDTKLLGVNNNKQFLQHVVRHEAFVRGEATTAFIADYFEDDASMSDAGPEFATCAKAAALYFHHSATGGNGWRSSADNSFSYKLEFDGKPHALHVIKCGGVYEITSGENAEKITIVTATEQKCIYVIDGVRRTADFAFEGDTLYLDDGTGHYRFDDITYKPAAVAGGTGTGAVKASMDGAIVDVRVAVGDNVQAGDTLIILEAMKMEHPLTAGISGIVEAVNVSVGQQVKSKQLLAVVGEEA